MNDNTLSDNPSTASHYLKIHFYEALIEWRRMLRTPMFTLPTLLFPWMFYLFFGIMFSRGQGAAAYLMVNYSVFGIIAPALFGFGVTVAVDRERGLLNLKRVVPMPLSSYLSAKIIMSLIFALLVCIGIYLLAYYFGDVNLTIDQWLSLTALLLIGVFPFCAFGIAIGMRSNAQAAPAIVNLLYLPMAFLSGLWIPIFMLPSALQQTAWLLPPYHLSQLALSVIGASQGHSPIWHLAALAVYTILFLLIAFKAYQNISDR